jgi:hypothetical protein
MHGSRIAISSGRWGTGDRDSMTYIIAEAGDPEIGTGLWNLLLNTAITLLHKGIQGAIQFFQILTGTA